MKIRLAEIGRHTEIGQHCMFYVFHAYNIACITSSFTVLLCIPTVIKALPLLWCSSSRIYGMLWMYLLRFKVSLWG